MGIGEKPDVGDHVSVDGDSILESERHDGRMECPRIIAGECGLYLASQVMDVEGGGVDDDIGISAQVAKNGALRVQPVDNALGALERMGPTRALEPAHEDVVG